MRDVFKRADPQINRLVTEEVLSVPKCARDELRGILSEADAAAASESLLCADCAAAEPDPDRRCALVPLKAKVVVVVNDAAARIMLGFSSHNSISNSIWNENSAAELRLVGVVLRRRTAERAHRLAHVLLHPEPDGSLQCPVCSFSAESRADADRQRDEVDRLIASSDSARRKHASSHVGQLYRPMTSIEHANYLPPLFRTGENHGSTHIVQAWPRAQVSGCSWLSQAARNELLNVINYEAVEILVNIGVMGARLPKKKGDEVFPPSLLGTEINKLCCSAMTVIYFARLIDPPALAREVAARRASSISAQPAPVAAASDRSAESATFRAFLDELRDETPQTAAAAAPAAAALDESDTVLRAVR